MVYQLEHHTVPTGVYNGKPVSLHVVQAGPADGPVLILLHGFPEFWYSWKQQIIPLAERGFRVWVPDQRGYNQSDKPAGVAAYAIDELAADVIALINATGRQKAVVVGHDWGAAVAWWVAATHPDRVERLVVLNVPHPAVMKRFVLRQPGQTLRSWYIGFFQLPWLPETLLKASQYAVLSRMLKTSSRPGTFSADDLRWYRVAWSGALPTMINWYRAALRYPPARDIAVRITVPMLLIWGVQDRFLSQKMAQPSIDLCDTGRVVFFENATHWVQHEEPDCVVALIAQI